MSSISNLSSRCCWRTRVYRTQQVLNNGIKRVPEEGWGRSGEGKGGAWVVGGATASDGRGKGGS